MTATLIVRHPVSDYAAWRAVYDTVGGLHAKHQVTSSQVLQMPNDANDVTVIHNFASLDNANGLAADPELKSAMERAGVAGAPRIEIFVSA